MSKLGNDPINLPVVLTEGDDFYDFLDYKVAGVPTDWPVGTTLTIEFATGASWEASFVGSGAGPTGDRAEWHEDKAVADVMSAGTVAWILYVNGTDDQVLSLGKVERRR